MSQKEVFESLYSIVLTRGLDRTLDSINLMYDAYIAQDNSDNKQKTEDVTAIKNELVQLFKETQNYRDSMFTRGMTEVDRNFFEKQKISKELLIQDLSQVEKEDTIFYDKKVVLTGVFSRYPVRNYLADIIKKLGADINTSISKKTEIVCIGEGAGPSKMAKIEQLRIEGCDILIINEQQLYNILDKL
jgi:NAD-dependent DNA ligase